MANTFHSEISRRRFLALSALSAGTALGAGSLLEACGGGSSPASSGGTTTLTVLGRQPGEFPPQYIPAFEKANPGIKVNLVNYDITRLNAMFAAGQSPDVVHTDGPATDLTNLMARGRVTSLDDYMAKSSLVKASDLEGVENGYRWNGKVTGTGSVYGLAKDWSQDGCFWYNKKLFDQAKVPHPSPTEPLTYNEFLELGKKLTVRHGNTIEIYGLDPIYEYQFYFPEILQMLKQDDQSLFSSDFTKSDFTKPAVIKVLQWFVDWAQAHVGPSPLDPVASPFPLFAADRIAIFQFGFWYAGQSDVLASIGKPGGLADHIGFAPAPQWGAKRINCSFGPQGSYIPAQSQNKDAAWRFLEFFIGGQPMVDHISSGYGLSPLKSMEKHIPQKYPYQQDAWKTQSNELQYLGFLQYSPYASGSAIAQVIDQYLQPVMKGQASLSGAAEQMTTAVNLLLQQGTQQIG